jgi:Ca2+-binding RTX toxin-like protein
MRHSLTRWLITLALIWSGVSWGSAVQAAATAGPADFADLSVTAASDPPLSWKIFLPAILLNSDGLVRVPVNFTFTFAADQYNTLPAGANRVRVTIAGAESISKELLRSTLPDPNGAGQLTFYLAPGQYTYTAQASQGSLLGSSVLSTIGPIPITVSPNFPLSIPMIAAFATFDNYQTDIGVDTANTFLSFGTPKRDRIVQYGGAANDLLSVDTGAGDDWVEQYGGSGDNFMVADTGTGNDYLYQEGGAGNNNMTATAGPGDNWVLQKGGASNDTINCVGGEDNDYIDQEGGAGNDTIRVTPGEGNDIVIINAGPGDDAIIYDVSIGTDIASIDGGDGNDTLIVNHNGHPFLIQDTNGNLIYRFGSGGTTTITVANVEHISVNGPNGTPVLTWP